jgi:hypothetical protein
MGQRTHDRYAIPLCPSCHRDLHALTGSFRKYTRARLLEWHNRMLIIYQPSAVQEELLAKGEDPIEEVF